MSLYRHKNTGNLYWRVADAAFLQCSTNRKLEEISANRPWTVYQSPEGHTYIRPTDEFNERFEIYKGETRD